MVLLRPHLKKISTIDPIEKIIDSDRSSVAQYHSCKDRKFKACIMTSLKKVGS